MGSFAVDLNLFVGHTTYTSKFSFICIDSRERFGAPAMANNVLVAECRQH
jgi:hypothetical protein